MFTLRSGAKRSAGATTHVLSGKEASELLEREGGSAYEPFSGVRAITTRMLISKMAAPTAEMPSAASGLVALKAVAEKATTD